MKKPMLAATIESPQDLDSISYPVLVSPKFDGVRCITDPQGIPHSRKGEPFQNKKVDQFFAQSMVSANLDGEIGVGDPTHKKFFTTSSGAVRREGYCPQEGFTFYVFDVVSDQPYRQRMQGIKFPMNTPDLKVVLVEQQLCHSKQQVMLWEEVWVKQGYEGIMIRGNIDSKPYKHGRSSLNSQELMKFKRFEDTEGILIGFEEGSTNNNEAKKDALGHTKRSSAKGGKDLNGRVGTLLVRSPRFEEVVRIGTGIGLTHKLREEMLASQEEFLGRTVTFAFQAGTDYVKARFPSFKGFRDDDI